MRLISLLVLPKAAHFRHSTARAESTFSGGKYGLSRITPENRRAFEDMLRNAGVDWQMHLFGGVVHSFTNPEADARGMPEYLRYDANADRRSWTYMAELLDEVFE